MNLMEQKIFFSFFSLPFFASCLSPSRFVYIFIIPNEREEECESGGRRVRNKLMTALNWSLCFPLPIFIPQLTIPSMIPPYLPVALSISLSSLFQQPKRKKSKEETNLCVNNLWGLQLYSAENYDEIIFNKRALFSSSFFYFLSSITT